MSRFSAVLLVSVLSLATLSTRPQKPKREFQPQADREDFWTLFDRDAKLSAVASVFAFTEGPVWDPADFLIVSDAVAKCERSLPEDLKTLTRIVTVSAETKGLGTIGVLENPNFSAAHKNKYGQDYIPTPSSSDSHP